MIDVRTEHLLPVKDLPDYLEARGLGRRVTMRAVKRWIHEGCHGARLEVVRIDDEKLTSLEAVQRWIHAQTTAGDSVAPSPRGQGADATPDVAAATPEHVASLHLLMEHRVVPTELDRLMRSLPGHAKTTIGYAAGALFRAGLRTPEDARRCGREGLLATVGIGPRAARVIESLWSALVSDRSSGPTRS